MCFNRIAKKNEVEFKNHGRKLLSKICKANKKENKLRCVLNIINEDEWLMLFSYMTVADIINCGMTSSTLLRYIFWSDKIKRRLGIEHKRLNDQVRNKVKIDLNGENFERLEILTYIAPTHFELMLYCSNVEATNNEQLEKRIIMTLDYMTRNNFHFESIEKLSIDLSNVERLSPPTCVVIGRFISQQRNPKELEINLHSSTDLFDEINGFINPSIKKLVDKSARTNPAKVFLMFPMLDTLECCQLYLPYLSAAASQTLQVLKLDELCFNSIRHLYAPNLESVTAKFVARIDEFWEVFVQQHPLLQHLNIEKLLNRRDYAEIINAVNLFPNLRTFMYSGQMIVSNV